MSRTLSILVAVVVVTFAAGCGSGKSCTDLCTQAQAGSCTAIRGNCAAFCTALDAVQGPSGCTSQRNEYQACLSPGSDVCANSCGAQENALSSCVTTYCAAHTSDPSCVTLAASF